MVKQVINVGANANDGTGDDLRTAMQKVNANFNELFGVTAEANDLVEDGTPQLGGNLDLQSYIINTSLTNGNISLQPNGTGSVLLKNIRITDNVISSDDSTSITINESLVVTGSATIPTINTNTIQSDDSTVISINDSVLISGNVIVEGDLRVNTIGINDSTPLSIISDVIANGNIDVTDTLTASTLAAEEIYTDAVEIVQNKISARRSNDNLVLSPSGTGNIDASGAKIINVTNPSASQDVATKAYVDGAVGGGVSGVTFFDDGSTSFTASAGDSLQFVGSTNISTSLSGNVLTITGPDLSSYLSAGNIITMVGDDSTGATFNAGETVKIAGASNITTAVSGDTVTITGPNLTNYVQKNDKAITVVGDDSTGVDLNVGETIKIAGSNNITTAVSGDTVTVTGSTNINVNSIASTDSSEIQINDSISVAGNATINGNVSATGTISGSMAFSNLTSTPTTIAGYGITDAVSTSTTGIIVVGDDSTGTNFTIGETLKVTGSSGITAAMSGDTLTISLVASGGVGTIGDLIVTGQAISGSTTDGDISIIPQGVGNINLDADRIRVGDLDSDVTISSNGSADLILKTDVDNPSISGMGSITIGDGVNGVTTIRTSDNGYVSVGNTTWTTLSTTGSRNEHGLAVTMDIDRNLSSVNLERYHASSIGARFNLQGTDPDNGNTVPYRAQQIELINNLLSKNLISKGWITFDPNSKNASIESIDSGGQMRGYSGGPVTLGVQNIFRNNTVSDVSVEETASISSIGTLQHTSAQRTITINNLHGIQQSFDLAASGGDSIADNIRAFVATGNYFTNGSATANNYYAFWAGRASEATNNWGVYIESADWENYLGGLTIVDSTIRADRSNENIYLETAGSGKVIVNDTLNVSTVELNEISSADSSAIQINDSVNVSGTLSVNTIDTNVISSGDSSAIQISDDLNISGSLTVHGTLNATVSTNEISSADSSAIQINDAVNISGTLNAKTIVTNDLISEDSSVINVLDGLNISGSLSVSEINSGDSSAITLNDDLNINGTLSVNTIDTNVIGSGDSSTIQINDSVQISDNLTMGGMLSLANRTVSELQALTPATGSIAYCTDESTGAQPVFYDGTNWRSIRTNNVITV